MLPDAMLIAIETNEDCFDYLNADIADSRFLAVHGSAADVRRIIADHGFDHADYILSGLPFSTLPNGVGPAIARETQAALRTGGAFLVYQYSPKVRRSEEHTSELQSLMRISYDVFCLENNKR